MDQKGWNRETTCYPTDACFYQNPVPAVSGYRWSYEIEADAGVGLSLGVGRSFGRYRIELSAALQKSALEQELIDVGYYDGSPRVPADGPVVVDAMALIDDVVSRSLTIDLFRDFETLGGALTPYVGVGVGQAYVEVQGLGFVAEYRDNSPDPALYDPPLSFYDSAQDGDYKDSALVWRLHAGANYLLGERTDVGLRLTWSTIGGTSDTGTYLRHPFHAQDPGFSNQNSFDEAQTWSLAVTLTHRLGAAR